LGTATSVVAKAIAATITDRIRTATARRAHAPRRPVGSRRSAWSLRRSPVRYHMMRVPLCGPRFHPPADGRRRA
jgi:hypothetical protein